LTALFDILLDIQYLETGLVPDNISVSESGMTLKKRLESLSPEESRSARRKFRKLWRKEMKRQVREGLTREELTKGKGQSPSPFQKSARRHIVANLLKRELNVW
tara:strand:- start:1630 stop:1941 length:312 start_codon:yes stop_codon:yes gene_type:complete